MQKALEREGKNEKKSLSLHPELKSYSDIITIK